MKIGLIPGHTKNSSGAVNYRGESEYPWALRVLGLMQKYLIFDSEIVTRNNIGISGAVKEAVKRGCKATFELHFNWASSDPSKDIEVLCSSKSPKSIKWAKAIAKSLNKNYESMGLRHDEGAKIDPSRGGNNVIQGYKNGIDYCVLAEPQFGNLNNSDARQIFEDDDKLAFVLAVSLNEFFEAEGFVSTNDVDPEEIPVSKPVEKWDITGFVNKLQALIDDPTDERKKDMKEIVLPSAIKKINEIIDSDQVEIQEVEIVKRKATLDGLVSAYAKAEIEFPQLKAITLAQWILESGRVGSVLSQDHYNFGGLKYRDNVPNCPESVYKVDYIACDGLDAYFGCPDYETYFKLYWSFIDRPPYKGWRDHVASGEEFIDFIVSCGYCPSAGYTDKVKSLLTEAQERLTEK